MSGTLDALILERAVKLWADPRMRRVGEFGRFGRDQGHCALGILMRARQDITGAWGDDVWKAGALIGYCDDPWRVAAINDGTTRNPFLNIFGQRYLYWRMKRALKKARA